MNKIKLVFALLVVVFGILGLTKIISYDVSSLVTSTCLGPVCLCHGIEELRSGKKGSAIVDFIFTAAFVLIASMRFLRIFQ